jgi:hypothetical protein
MVFWVKVEVATAQVADPYTELHLHEYEMDTKSEVERGILSYVTI